MVVQFEDRRYIGATALNVVMGRSNQSVTEFD